MEIQPVADILAPADLGPPVLRALIPSEDNYSVLLFQPRGHIEASPAGVRHQDREVATKQFRAFLNEAHNTKAELVVTPEYSMPWEILTEAIEADTVPAEGSLWALGCESIKYAELDALKLRLAPHATVLYESLQPDAQRFLDPLAYVFSVPSIEADGARKLVVLVQFKTCPMGDADHFEVNGMQRGTRVYQFGGSDGRPRLLTLICSDALAFLDPIAEQVYDRALILHLQLNPQPRQYLFRQYRDRLFRFGGGATEVLCLNWAKDVHTACGATTQCWNNIAGSAWYLCPDTFDDRDATLSLNHQKGLYYTWCHSMRSHALFFNYEPGVYQLTASKVSHLGVVAALSRRRGPQLTAMLTWDEQGSAWVPHPGPEDGFAAAVAQCGSAKPDIEQLAKANPFNAERVLALSAGNIGTAPDWYHPRSLDSCVIEPSEIIRRMTFCQDTDPSGRSFRAARLSRCARLWDILKTDAQLPAALNDLKGGFCFEWAPHQNIVSASRRRATVVYMGEEATEADIEAVGKRIAEYLQRASADPDAGIEARQRLHLWYRKGNGEIQLFDRARYLKFDEARSGSEFDIATGS